MQFIDKQEHTKVSKAKIGKGENTSFTHFCHPQSSSEIYAACVTHPPLPPSLLERLH